MSVYINLFGSVVSVPQCFIRSTGKPLLLQLYELPLKKKVTNNHLIIIKYVWHYMQYAVIYTPKMK